MAPILADIKVYLNLHFYIVKKIRKTYKMYMKTLTCLISRLRSLILAVKDKNRLI